MCGHAVCVVNRQDSMPYVWSIDRTAKTTASYNNNNNDFLCANILEDQAQWRDKTKGLSNCVNVEQCVSH